jgi:hypothetical protein
MEWYEIEDAIAAHERRRKAEVRDRWGFVAVLLFSPLAVIWIVPLGLVLWVLGVRF